ncbi:MAG: CBS domain-containing protein [Planctomycetaceae bacterium]|nr:CBS domain-containing protein [Planctomycetaceae bacterium]
MTSSNVPPTSDQKFEDPLENYDPPNYEDPLEAALDSRAVSELQAQPCEIISADTTVADAVGQLAHLHHASLLIERDGKLVGMFTDRDLLDRVVLEYEACKDQPVSSVMTSDPVYVRETDSPAAVLAIMAVSGFRHVPVLAGDGAITGIVSPRRITEFLLEHSSPE